MRFPLLALCLLSSTAFARLGETSGQIENRYGAPTAITRRNPDGSVAIAEYVFQGYAVEVRFANGISVREAYLQRGRFTEEQAIALLAINTNGATWITIDFGRSYQRADGTGRAGGVGSRLFYVELTAGRAIGPAVGF